MRQLLVIGALALNASVASAESIREESFLAALEDRHVAARALKDGLGLAEAARIRAGTLANPRVEFWREAPDDNPRVTNWMVAWSPPLDGRYRPGKQAAEKGLAAAQEHFVHDMAVLRREARGAFATWSLGYERLDVLRGQFDLVGRLAQQQQERATVGEDSGLAARRFMLAADEVRASLRAAEAEYGSAEAAARAWRPDLPSDATPSTLSLPTPPIVPAAPEGPELRALAYEVDQAGLDERRAERFWGFPTLLLGWQDLDDGRSDQSGPIVGAGWTVPLLDRDKAARVEAAHRKEVAGARLEWAKTRLTGEIEGGVKAYEVLFGSAQESREAARETDRIIEAATAAFRAGEANLTDLFETLRAALAARLREIDARAQALEVHRRLEAVLGQPLAGGIR